MSTYSQIQIPILVDEPPYLLLWSIEEIMPIMFGLLIGIFMDQALLFTFIGLIMAKLYSRFRDQTPRGYLFHVLYYYGIYPAQSKTFINPFIKRIWPI